MATPEALVIDGEGDNVPSALSFVHVTLKVDDATAFPYVSVT